MTNAMFLSEDDKHKLFKDSIHKIYIYIYKFILKINSKICVKKLTQYYF